MISKHRIPGGEVVHEADEHPADPPEEPAPLSHKRGSTQGGSLQVFSTFIEIFLIIQVFKIGVRGGNKEWRGDI